MYLLYFENYFSSSSRFFLMVSKPKPAKIDAKPNPIDDPAIPVNGNSSDITTTSSSSSSSTSSSSTSSSTSSSGVSPLSSLESSSSTGGVSPFSSSLSCSSSSTSTNLNAP